MQITKFMTQNKLQENNEEQYLKDDRMCFKISFEPIIPAGQLISRNFVCSVYTLITVYIRGYF